MLPPVSSVLSPEPLPPYLETGVRVVPILDPLAPKLLAAKADSIYIFSEDNGKMHLTEMQYQRLWNEYAEQTGISTTAHQLRYSSATMLFECDMDVKDAQDLLGHSTAAMTQDIYTHVRDTHRKKTAQLINEKLRQN